VPKILSADNTEAVLTDVQSWNVGPVITDILSRSFTVETRVAGDEKDPDLKDQPWGFSWSNKNLKTVAPDGVHYYPGPGKGVFTNVTTITGLPS
jgi:hypothetical protein